MQPITIPRNVFDDLSSGYGDREAMRLLREGTRARRVLLLKEIAGGSQPARKYLGLIARAADLDPAQAEAVLAHPPIEPWAVRYLSGTAGVDYLGRLAAAAALRAGLPFELSLPTEDGVLVLPTVGAVTGLEAAQATITGTGEGFGIQCGALRLLVSKPFEVAALHWRPVHVVEAGSLRLAIEDTDSQRDCFGYRVTPTLALDQIRELSNRLREAWNCLETDHPRHAECMREALRVIVPLARPPGGGAVSATARGALGAVAVSADLPPAGLALQILHEFMHMKLWALQDLVKLHRDGGEAIYFAPWRSDPRSTPALLQGAFAHVGVTDFWRVRRLGTQGTQRREAELEFVFWLEQTRIAVAELLASGELTGEGVQLVHGLDATLAGWAEAEPVPAGLRELAGDLITVAAVGWRLRNTLPEQGELADLLRLRAAGGDCPGRLKPPSVSPAAGATGRRPSTLELGLRGRYTGRPAVPDEPAHRAFLDGDYPLAMALYRRALERDHAAEEAWSGLALAVARSDDPLASGALTRRPDLVRAITSQTRDDPVAVARWLGAAATAPP